MGVHRSGRACVQGSASSFLLHVGANRSREWVSRASLAHIFSRFRRLPTVLRKLCSILPTVDPILRLALSVLRLGPFPVPRDKIYCTRARNVSKAFAFESLGPPRGGPQTHYSSRAERAIRRSPVRAEPSRRRSFEQSESRKARISMFPCPGGTGSEPSSGRAQDILRSSGELLVNLGSLGNQTQGGPLSCRSSGKLLVAKRVSDSETQEQAC